MSVHHAQAFDVDDDERRRLAPFVGHRGEQISVRSGDSEIELGGQAGRAVEALLEELASGAVHLVPAGADLTTGEAADLLGISRTFVVRLIEDGKLAAHMTGSHRRVRALDALAYLDRREARFAAVEDIAVAGIELGID